MASKVLPGDTPPGGFVPVFVQHPALYQQQGVRRTDTTPLYDQVDEFIRACARPCRALAVDWSRELKVEREDSDGNAARFEQFEFNAGRSTVRASWLLMLAVGTGVLLRINWEKIEALRASMQMPAVGAALWIITVSMRVASDRISSTT